MQEKGALLMQRPFLGKLRVEVASPDVQAVYYFPIG